MKNNRKQAGATRTRIVLAIAGMVVIFVGGMVAENSLYTKYIAQKYGNLDTKTDYKLPVELQELSTKSGVSKEQMIKTKMQIGAAGDECKTTSFQACYNGQKDIIRIYIKAFENHPEQSIAYEYFHHVWQKEITEQERQDLTSDIFTMYSNMIGNPSYKDLTNHLIQSEGGLETPQIKDELQAIACTQVKDQNIPAKLLQYCNSHNAQRANFPKEY